MKTKKIWPILLIVIIIATAAGIIIFNSTDAAKFRKQLNLGQRYLSEMNYEEAVVAFNQAIEIDPRNADAYLGLADAYIGLGDEEAALAALQAGYEATGDERLRARMDEMSAAGNEGDTGLLESEEENNELKDRILEIDDMIYGQGGVNSFTSDGSSWLLTYDQIETAYRPLAEELEGYLEQDQGEWNGFLLRMLSAIYLHLGDMDKCLETRRKGYEATGWIELMPDAHEDENGNAYDEYGRLVSDNNGSAFTYGEADRCLTWSGSSDSYYTQYEYDDFGRIKRVFIVAGADFVPGPDILYEYQADYSVIFTFDGYDSGTRITYNEYGVHLSRTDITGVQ